MTSSIYSTMPIAQDYHQHTTATSSSDVNATINSGHISSNQESIDLLTASTKFVPSSSSNNMSSGKHNHLNNIDMMDDIDSNDDMYDDDLMDCENNQLNKNYKLMNSNSLSCGGNNGSMIGSNQMSNNIPNLTGKIYLRQ